MKVKTIDGTYDTNDSPVMLIFDDRKAIERAGINLLQMGEGCTKYCIYPDRMTENEVIEFMGIDE